MTFPSFGPTLVGPRRIGGPSHKTLTPPPSLSTALRPPRFFRGPPSTSPVAKHHLVMLSPPCLWPLVWIAHPLDPVDPEDSTGPGPICKAVMGVLRRAFSLLPPSLYPSLTDIHPSTPKQALQHFLPFPPTPYSQSSLGSRGVSILLIICHAVSDRFPPHATSV